MRTRVGAWRRRRGEGSTPPAGGSSGEPGAVSTVELFFDLVFVFTITQLTTLLVTEPNPVGIAKSALIFGNVWWMYGGYAWLTNAVPPRELLSRVLLLLGMAGFMVIALAIPQAFGSSGVAFGVGYLLVTLVHTAMFVRSSHLSVVKAMIRLGPFNFVTAAILLAAGFTHGWLQWALWTVAFALHWATPFLIPLSGFRIVASHFVERHGLIVLIALGESVLAVGLGVRSAGLGVGPNLIALMGLVLSMGLWWLYFDGDDVRAVQALVDAGARAPWLALYAFGYAFMPVLGGIAAFAGGLRLATGHFGDTAAAPAAWLIAGGAATYIAGLALWRRILRAGTVAIRLPVAGLVLSTAVLGMRASTAAELALLGFVVVAGILSEAALQRRQS